MWSLDIQQWLLPNRRAHQEMIKAAGFEVVSSGGVVRQHFGPGFPRRPLRRVRRLRHAVGVYQQWTGIPSQWVLARVS
jgi:hypothetical protein